MMFAAGLVSGETLQRDMLTAERAIERTDAPVGRPIERLDVRAMGPPQPLKRTLETLVEMDNSVLVQYNDRVPRFLYPKLDDRGYEYETVEADDAVVTAIWE